MQQTSRKTAVRLFKGAADLKKLGQAIREVGLMGTLGRVRHVLTFRLHTFADRNFDRKFNVDTSTHAYSWNLSLKSEGDDIGDDEPLYLPTSSWAFRAAMSCLPDDLSKFVFVDFGSGKGRTLLLASDYDFKGIVGVEFAKELHVAAERNVASYRRSRQKCFDIRCEHVDATLFDIPAESCVFYFFHPFEEPVMRKVLAHIRASYQANVRKMYFVYYKARYPAPFREQDFLIQSSAVRRGVYAIIPNPNDLLIFETASDSAR